MTTTTTGILSDTIVCQMELLRQGHVAIWTWLADTGLLYKFEWPKRNEWVESARYAGIPDTVIDIFLSADCFACAAKVLMTGYMAEIGRNTLVEKACQKGLSCDAVETLITTAFVGSECVACPLWRSAACHKRSTRRIAPTGRISDCLSGLFRDWHESVTSDRKECATVIRDLKWVSDPFEHLVSDVSACKPTQEERDRYDCPKRQLGDYGRDFTCAHCHRSGSCSVMFHTT